MSKDSYKTKYFKELNSLRKITSNQIPPITDASRGKLSKGEDVVAALPTKATTRRHNLRKNEDEKVFALAYEIKGNTACNYAFTITDSSQHFFSGQLLFQTKPNYDSLKPCISFIIEDLEEMISSFQWVN